MPQKSVLITGCSDGGIGAALAAEFQLRGLRVFATARDPSKMASLAALGIETLPLDVTSEESIAQAVIAVREKLSSSGKDNSAGEGEGLDLLINNAGVNHILPFTDTKVSDMRRVFETNVIGTMAVTQAFIPLLIPRKSAASSSGNNNKSTVVMLGSINEVFHPPYQAMYSASKAAVHTIARTLRVELAPLGIGCVTLMTGSVRTNLFDNAPTEVPDDSYYKPVADGIVNRDFLKGAQWVDADVFAKQVATDLLRASGPKPNIWRGGLATFASWLGWLGWEGILDSAMHKGNRLDEVKP